MAIPAISPPPPIGTTSISRRGIDPAVLRAATCAGLDDRLDLERLGQLVTIVADAAGEHVLLSDGLRSIRFDLVEGSLCAGPAALRWQIEGIHGAAPQLVALRRLVALARAGRFARSLHPAERRARRWTQMLRVHDAIAAGATQREIVGGLFGIEVEGARWRLAAGPWRLRVQRLAAGARAALALGAAGWFGTGLD